MKSIILASLLLFSGLTATAGQVIQAKCEVQSIELKNMEWGTPTPRLYLDCGKNNYYTQTYIDFHYVNNELALHVIENLKVGEVLDLEVTLNGSLMYTYPDMVTSIHSSGGFDIKLTYQDELMYVHR